MIDFKSEDILTCLLLIVVGYFIAKFFSRSCNGFSVGGETTFKCFDETGTKYDDCYTAYKSTSDSEDGLTAQCNNSIFEKSGEKCGTLSQPCYSGQTCKSSGKSCPKSGWCPHKTGKDPSYHPPVTDFVCIDKGITNSDHCVAKGAVYNNEIICKNEAECKDFETKYSNLYRCNASTTCSNGKACNDLYNWRVDETKTWEKPIKTRAQWGYCDQNWMCNCKGNLPGGGTEKCYWDESCLNGGIGCNAKGVKECRFCGFDQYPPCPSAPEDNIPT
jgi:hypothetical protein